MIQLKMHSLGHSTPFAVSHDTAPVAMAGATPLRRFLNRRASNNIFMKRNGRSRNAVIGNVASRTVCSASVQVRDTLKSLNQFRDF